MSNVGIPVDTANFSRPLLSPHASARSLNAARHDADEMEQQTSRYVCGTRWMDTCMQTAASCSSARVLSCSRPFLTTAQ